MSRIGRKRNSKWDLKEEPQLPLESSNWDLKEEPQLPLDGSKWDLKEPQLPLEGSKWDLKEEPQLPLEGWHDDGWLRESGLSYRGKESPRAWHASKPVDLKDRQWGEQMNERIGKDCMTAWGEDENGSGKLSPGLDKWRQERSLLSSSQGCNRPHRGRSRSRSRSRSLGSDSKLELSMSDSSRSRPGASNQVCRNFSSGRCWRGDRCQYLHNSNQNNEDRRHSECNSIDGRDRRSAWGCPPNYSARYETREYATKNGRSVDFNEGVKDRKSRDASSEHPFDHEYRRAGRIPCRFFPTGNCRNGKNCKFLHHGQTDVNVDGRSPYDRCKMDRSSGHGEKFKGERNWGDSLDSVDFSEIKNEKIDCSAIKQSLPSVNDEWDFRFDHENELSAAINNCNSIQSDENALIQCGAENSVPELGVSKATDAEKWIGKMEEPVLLNCRVRSPSSIIKEGVEYLSHNSHPTCSLTYANTAEHDTIPEGSIWMHRSPASIQPMVYGKSFSESKPSSRVDLALSHPSGDRNASGNGSGVYPDINFSAAVLTCRPNGYDNSSSSAQPLTTSDVVGHGQLKNVPTHIREQPVPTFDVAGEGQPFLPNLLTEPSVSVSNADVRGQLTHLPIPGEGNSEIFPTQVQYLEGQLKKPVVAGGNTPLARSEILPPPNTVNNEQLAQLTNLSASLAQLLVNGKQLPQLYAALNPTTAAIPLPLPNNVGLASQVASVSCEPNSIAGSQKQHDPLSDNTELIKPGELSGVNSSKIVVLGDLNQGKSVADLEANGSNRMEAKETEKNDEEAPVHLSNPGANDQVDANKKNKDAKGLRAFKFALAEFVKELLKPTWKDGQINKDAYKIIVKKVVDKVTGTMQGGSIPQNQDKINHYLSFSKPKLTKLVQAYVERHQKS